MNLNYLFYHKYFDYLADAEADKPVRTNQILKRTRALAVPQSDSLGQTFFMKTT